MRSCPHEHRGLWNSGTLKTGLRSPHFSEGHFNIMAEIELRRAG